MSRFSSSFPGSFTGQIPKLGAGKHIACSIGVSSFDPCESSIHFWNTKGRRAASWSVFKITPHFDFHIKASRHATPTINTMKMNKLVRQLELMNSLLNKLRRTSATPQIGAEAGIPTLNVDEAVEWIKGANNFEDILLNGFLLNGDVRTQTLRLTLTPQLLR
ncbi:hypothetical protein K493DRAFT_308023 [Basidiobolus meristosporus CBS 931.73]|uniref:Uncharacterized protein n=1 Tax=Basidiobolus meristosporus CBS 931.73 TaxID=1314790 RepID=A0A1Y1X8H0_9FUNG|nr:hypothetical protein K493DRAFT_308023 [Basidiobolus meristosporus CBS 931.73]|eukprot:ORX81634.1 hypothetical protein K493DRAFT_308023 [Basidiobolus meristosporus CBS 931.73]